MMVVGILQVELAIDGVVSIKDKRRVVASLKDRLHREHPVSVAEVDMQDSHGTAVLGIALAASDVKVVQSLLQRILQKLEAQRDCVLTDHRMDIMTGIESC